MSDPFNFGAPPGQPPQGSGQQQNPLAGAGHQQPGQEQAGQQQAGQQHGQNQGSQHGAEHSAGARHRGSGTSSPFGSGGGDPFAPAGHSMFSDPFARGGQPTATLPSVSTSGQAPGGTISVAKPPAYLLFAAIALAIVAAVLAGLLAIPGVAIGAWVVAGPIAIGIIALFVIRDTWARSGGVYAAPGWVKPLYYTAIVVCLLCILVPAIRIALWVGRW